MLECSNVEKLIEQGYIDAEDIEHRVKGQVKKKVKILADSLFGTLTTHQIFIIRGSWKHIEFLEESIDELDESIGKHLEIYQDEFQLIQTVPGISKVTAA